MRGEGTKVVFMRHWLGQDEEYKNNEEG